jgi:hypothetical protein
VTLWYVLTRQWFPVQAVAGQPDWSTIQTWLAYSFGPLTNVVANHAPGYAYPDGPFGVETILFALTIASILGSALVWLTIHRRAQPLGRAAAVGASALFVVISGVACAWVASLVLPPSMNPRNLAALLPALFLAIACASTPALSERVNRWTAAAVVSVWLAAAALVIGQFGVGALAPAWQLQAGYRATAQTLLAATQENPAPALIGLELPWDWHGEWDAILRAELDRPPAESADPAPLDVRWIMDVEELRASGLPSSPLVVFTDASDQRSADLFAWLEQARPGCQPSVLGGPGYGVVSLLYCPPAPDVTP